MPPVIGSFDHGEAKPGETAPRIGYATPLNLVSQPEPGVDTVYDVLISAAKRHGNKPAVGYREVLDIIEEEKEVKKFVDGQETVEKKKWKYFQMSEFKYYTYIEFKDKVLRVASGLRELGLEPNQVFNIYAMTSVHWQIVSYACSSISVTVATAYDTLGESGLQHSLNEPEVQGVFTNADLLKTLLSVLDNCPTVKLVIYDGKAEESTLQRIASIRNGEVKVISLEDVEKLGEEKKHEPIPPKKDDVVCIMYTSGTTGAPKGVVILHSNIVATVGSVLTLLGKHLRADDTFLAYLPLAHILEYVVEVTWIYVGMTMGYGRVKTLTDASVRNCKGDLRAFQPTIMTGVPAVWETIRKGILLAVNKGGAVKKRVFNAALGAKKFAYSNKLPVVGGVMDSLVFNQVKQQTGGRLRLTLSGGAQLSKETQEFLTMALVTVLTGYGLTETCGMATILPPEFMQYGPVGVPVPSMEIKLVDVPDAGYTTDNTPPQGEILVRGNSLCKGYFKRPDLDKEAFTEDGWFMTGDIGQWEKDGTMSIIDRKKNLVKLSGGEYIALERLESIYKSCHVVSNICVHADPDAKQPMAIIHPHEPHLRQFSSSSDHTSFAELCADPKIRAAVLKECNSVGRKAGLKSMEILEAVILTSEEWTPENGMVTAAQKLQRKKVAEHYMDEIREVYNVNED